jgi:hypothetical protein
MPYITKDDIKDVVLRDHLKTATNETYYLEKGDSYLNDLATEKGAESVSEPLSYKVQELLICKICSLIANDRIGTKKGAASLREGAPAEDIYYTKWKHYTDCVSKLEQEVTKELIDGSTPVNYSGESFEHDRA